MSEMYVLIRVDCQSADDKKRLIANFESHQEIFNREVDDFCPMYNMSFVEHDDVKYAVIDVEMLGFYNTRCMANLINYILDLANVSGIEVLYEDMGNSIYGKMTYESGDDFLTCREVKQESWPEDIASVSFYDELDELLDNDDDVLIDRITL